MIGVIADDISGAAETAGVALRHGLSAEVLLKGRPSGKADVVCIDTDSRLCSANEAARRSAVAAKTLRRAGAKWIYKKVDSVLRGQVAAEIVAIRKELRSQNVLLHPANPSLGRTIKNGNYFVRGKLIHKTEFANDPAHPRKTANVIKLLGGGLASCARVCKLNERLDHEEVVLCESTSPRDVQAWARRTQPKMLLAGGAEFFAAVLAHLGAPASRRQVPAAAKRRWDAGVPSLELFVCGTTSKSSQKFVRAAKRAGTPVFSLPKELAWGSDFTRPALKIISEQVLASFQKHPRVILQTGLPPVHEIPVAKRLAGHLTQLAEVVLNQSNVQCVYAEGGATAVELARRMGWTRLAVLRELAPGVTTLAINSNRSLQLTVKPGTYVWPDEIQKAPAALKIKKLKR